VIPWLSGWNGEKTKGEKETLPQRKEGKLNYCVDIRTGRNKLKEDKITLRNTWDGETY